MTGENNSVKLSEVLNNPNFKNVFKVSKQDVYYWKNDGLIRHTSTSSFEDFDGRKYDQKSKAYFLTLTLSALQKNEATKHIKKIIFDRHQYSYKSEENNQEKRACLVNIIVKSADGHTIEFIKKIGEIDVILDTGYGESINIISATNCNILDGASNPVKVSYEQTHYPEPYSEAMTFPNVTEFNKLSDVELTLKGKEFRGIINSSGMVEMNAQAEKNHLTINPTSFSKINLNAAIPQGEKKENLPVKELDVTLNTSNSNTIENLNVQADQFRLNNNKIKAKNVNLKTKSFTGNISSENDCKVECDHFKGEINSKQKVDLKTNKSFEGKVTAIGDISVTSKGTIKGSFENSGFTKDLSSFRRATIKFDAESTEYTNIKSKGWVKLNFNKIFKGQIQSDGFVEVESWGGDFNGYINAAGTRVRAQKINGSITIPNGKLSVISDELYAHLTSGHGNAYVESKVIGSENNKVNMSFDRCNEIDIRFKKMIGNMNFDSCKKTLLKFDQLKGDMTIKRAETVNFNFKGTIQGDLRYDVQKMLNTMGMAHIIKERVGLTVTGKHEYIGPKPLAKDAINLSK